MTQESDFGKWAFSPVRIRKNRYNALLDWLLNHPDEFWHPFANSGALSTDLPWACERGLVELSSKTQWYPRCSARNPLKVQFSISGPFQYQRFVKAMQLTEVAKSDWASGPEIDRWTTLEPTQFRVMKSTGGLSHAMNETGQRSKRNRTPEKLLSKWLRGFERDVVVFQDRGGGVNEIEQQCHQCGLQLDSPQIVHILENGDTVFENPRLASIDPRHMNPQICDPSPRPRMDIGNSSRSTHIKCIPKKFLREVIGSLRGRGAIDNKSLIKAMLELGVRIDPNYDQSSRVFAVPIDVRSLRNLPPIQNEELLYAALSKWLNPPVNENQSIPS